MARKKIKWRLPFLLYLVCISVFTKSLPLENAPFVITATDSIIVKDKVYITTEAQFLPTESIIVEDKVYITTDAPQILPEESVHVVDIPQTTTEPIETEETNTTKTQGVRNSTLTRNEPVRPGQVVPLYTIQITPNGDTFDGRAIIRVELQAATREDLIVFHAENLNVHSVMYGIFTLANPMPAVFYPEDGFLIIEPPAIASTYIFLIEYTGDIRNDGSGLHRGSYGDK